MQSGCEGREEGCDRDAGQESLVIVIEDGVAAASEVIAVACRRLVSAGDSDVGNQRTTGGGDAYQDEEVEGVEDGSSPGVQKPATMVDAVAVATMDQKGNDVMEKIAEMMKKPRTENLFLHGGLVAERAAHARALMDDIRL